MNAKSIAVVIAFLAFEGFIYHSGYSDAEEDYEKEKLKIENSYKEKELEKDELVRNILSERDSLASQVAEYRLSNARNLERLRSFESMSRNKNTARACVNDGIGKRDEFIVRGSELLERCSGILSKYELDRKTALEIQNMVK